MSRLETRLGRLERILGRCRDCKTIVELVHDGSPSEPARIEYCPSCAQPLERVMVWLSFDPDASEA